MRRAFGIGQRTGIFDDQGESAGLAAPVNKWSGLSITRIPMGQEVPAYAGAIGHGHECDRATAAASSCRTWPGR